MNETLSIVRSWHDPRYLQPGELEVIYGEALEAKVFAIPGTVPPSVGVADRELVKAIFMDPDTFDNQLTLFPHFGIEQEPGAMVGALMAETGPSNTAGGSGSPHAAAREAIDTTFHTSFRSAHEHLGGLIQKHVRGFMDRLEQNRNPSGSSYARLGGVALHDQVDVMPLIWDLPLLINSELIGFPPEWHERIKKASLRQIAFVWGNLPKEGQIEGAQGLRDLWEMSLELVQEHRQAHENGHSYDDFTGHLIQHTNANGQQLTDKEIAQIIMNFAVAGHETTANSIANGLRYLMDNPSAWQNLVSNPDQIPGAVREMLRLFPSIIAWTRRATRDTKIGDVEVKEGTRVVLFTGAANRDPNFYGDDANEFRPDRSQKQNLTFGHGVRTRLADRQAGIDRRYDSHFCPGSGAAELTMNIFFRELVRQYPELQPTQHVPEYHANIAFRSMREYILSRGERVPVNSTSA